MVILHVIYKTVYLTVSINQPLTYSYTFESQSEIKVTF